MIFSSSFDDTKMFLSVLLPLKCISTPCFLQIFLRLSHIPSTYGTTIWHLVWCVLLGIFFFSLFWCFWKIFCIAHLGYLHAPSTFSRCWSSCLANSGVELMVWALCVRVLLTLYLEAISCALVPWEVQVSVGGFPIHPYCKTSIFFWFDDSVQKRYGPIFILPPPQ